MVFDAPLLNTQHYKVRIKGKVEQSRERSSALPYTSGHPRLRSPTLLLLILWQPINIHWCLWLCWHLVYWCIWLDLCVCMCMSAKSATASLLRGKPYQLMSWIWHQTIWWWGSSLGVLGKMEFPFIAITPGRLWFGAVLPLTVLSMGQIELFDNLTVCKQMTYIKLNC